MFYPLLLGVDAQAIDPQAAAETLELLAEEVASEDMETVRMVAKRIAEETIFHNESFQRVYDVLLHHPPLRKSVLHLAGVLQEKGVCPRAVWQLEKGLLQVEMEALSDAKLIAMAKEMELSTLLQFSRMSNRLRSVFSRDEVWAAIGECGGFVARNKKNLLREMASLRQEILGLKEKLPQEIVDALQTRPHARGIFLLNKWKKLREELLAHNRMRNKLGKEVVKIEGATIARLEELSGAIGEWLERHKKD